MLADKYAKEASENGEILNYYCPHTDLIPEIRNKIINDWRNQFREDRKGQYYKNLQPFPPGKPWFSQQ